ncbi:MAG: hypothetical protein RJA63_4100 [Pseudomonadota bacterium]|jgi:hypothetical protein
MAVELRDLRAKITVEADAALDAEARASGMDRSEIVRDVLHTWASDRIDMAKLLLRRLEFEGLAGAPEGVRGRVG